MSATDTVLLTSLAREPGKAIRLESCGMGFSGMPAIFVPSLRWSARADRVVVATTAQYEVRVFEGDSLLHVVRRTIAPAPATAAAAQRELGDGMRVRTEGGERVCDPVELVEQRGFAPVIPAIASVAIDPDGRLWVERGHVRGDPAAIDLFDARGDYLGTLPPGTPLPVVFLSARRVATIETDELDVQRIAIHDLVATGS